MVADIRHNGQSNYNAAKKGAPMKPFTTIAAGFFALVAVVHLLRLFIGWEIMVNGMLVPRWISAPGLMITAGMALMLWREARR